MSAVVEAREPSAKYITHVEPTLVRAFGLLATAPNGLARLRELIHTLAVQGKLTRQDPNDEPAAALLQRIAKAAGREPPEIKGDSPLPGWIRTAFGDYALELCTGPFGSLIAKDEYVDGGVPLVNPSHMKNGRIEAQASISVSSDKAIQLKAYALAAGDIVFARRGEVGRTALVTNHEHGWLCGTGSFFARLHPDIDRAYLQLVFDSASMRAYLGGAAVGSTMVNLNQRILLSAPIDVPPLAEQQRIVARVEELMKLCDALEQSGRLVDEQHARLTSTLFDALATSESAQALAENWQRVAEQFDLLLDRPEAVDAFEQIITQLAVRGLLVPQDNRADSGRNLLVRFLQAGSESGKRAKAELAPLGADDTPFSTPELWAWARLGDVVDITGGVTLGRKGALANPLSLPYLRVANVQRGHLNLATEVKTVSIDAAELPRFQLKAGDLLITEGGDWDKVGRTCIWRNEIPTCLHQNHIFRVRGRTAEWSPEWGQLYLNSADARAYFASSAKQTTNLASINMTQLRHCALPLPPLAEQHRIVARVEELRRLCADLRERLTQGQEVQSSLADALVAKVA